MGQYHSRSTEDGVGTGIQNLDKKLLEMVLSFTTPRDACRVALVSASFRSAADSDSVWERFLPRDYMDIINSAVDPAPLWNLIKKKELYFRLCDPILINKGSMTFSLDRVSGKKSCMLAAWSNIDITWVGTKQYWIKVQRYDSRFAKAVELVSICWLEITTWLDCNLVPLSLHTTYVAYLVFKLTPKAYGLHSQYAVIHHGDQWTNKKVSLEAIWSEFGEDDNDDKDEEELRTELTPQRSDGWAEVEIGEFFYDGVGDGRHPVVTIRLHQWSELHWKSGLIVEGLELRPKL